jgi:hypothetical protein
LNAEDEHRERAEQRSAQAIQFRTLADHPRLCWIASPTADLQATSAGTSTQATLKQMEEGNRS